MVIHTNEKEGRTSWELDSYFFQQKRTVFITGEITDALCEEANRQILYLAGLSKDPITLRINSRGGSVTGGLSLFDTMRGCGCEIITVCSGAAASMAAFILAAGTPGKRYCAPNAEIMIHQIIGSASGQASDIERTADHIRDVKKRYIALMAEMTGKDPEKIRTDTDRDCYMSAQEAVDYGIADRIGICLPDSC